MSRFFYVISRVVTLTSVFPLGRFGALELNKNNVKAF